MVRQFEIRGLDACWLSHNPSTIDGKSEGKMVYRGIIITPGTAGTIGLAVALVIMIIIDLLFWHMFPTLVEIGAVAGIGYAVPYFLVRARDAERQPC